MTATLAITIAVLGGFDVAALIVIGDIQRRVKNLEGKSATPDQRT